MKTNQTRRHVPFMRILLVLLCCVMCFSLFQTVAFALTVVEVKANKILENAELDGGDFRFELSSDELEINGATEPIEATNDPEGNIVFRFEIPDGTPPGDYSMTMREIDTGKEGVDYDTEPREITLTINNNGTYIHWIMNQCLQMSMTTQIRR